MNLPGIACIVVAVLPGLVAQSSIRGWTTTSWDTGAFEVPTQSLAIRSTGDTVGVVRADGRVFVYGSETGFGGLCRPPLPPPGVLYTDVAISGYFAVALRSDGQIDTWNVGYGYSLPAAPALPPGMTYTQVAVGAEHAVALRRDGQVLAWGDGSLGRLAVPTIPTGLSVVKVVAGGLWSMVLCSDGSLIGWGVNNTGQLTIPSLAPGVRFTDVAAGYDHLAALLSDGSAIAWGDNLSGQCNLPPLLAGQSYVKIACGMANTLLVRSDQVLVAVGDNSNDQCSTTPAIPSGRTCLQIVMGYPGGLALLSDRSVIGWGRSTTRALPAIGSSVRWSHVACGVANFLGLGSDGVIRAWPEGLGTGVTTVPPLPPGTRYTEVSNGMWHAAAMRSDQQLVMWGYNPDGRCTPPPLPAGQHYTHATLSDTHSVALRSDGMAVAFGGSWSQLTIPPLPPGLGYLRVAVDDHSLLLLRSDGVVVPVFSVSSQVMTVPPLPAGRTVMDIALLGSSLAAALMSDGQVIVWGGSVPLPVLPPGVVFVEIRGGMHHLLLRRSDGQVVVMGGNSYLERNVPPLQPGESYLQVSARREYSAARVGRTSTYVAYTNGCAGSMPTCHLIPRDTPQISEVLELHLHDLPQSLAILAFGWQRGPVVDLTPLGAPGCRLEASVDATVFLAGAAQQARFAATLPNSATLLGTRFCNQAAVLDAGANALGVVLSDACEGIVGG